MNSRTTPIELLIGAIILVLVVISGDLLLGIIALLLLRILSTLLTIQETLTEGKDSQSKTR